MFATSTIWRLSAMKIVHVLPPSVGPELIGEEPAPSISAMVLPYSVQKLLKIKPLPLGWYVGRARYESIVCPGTTAAAS